MVPVRQSFARIFGSGKELVLKNGRIPKLIYHWTYKLIEEATWIIIIYSLGSPLFIPSGNFIGVPVTKKTITAIIYVENSC